MSTQDAQVAVTLTVNGKEFQRHIDPRTLLVDFIRRDLMLTGTHVGCDTSQCGACTVLLDGHAVKSCTILAAQASGSAVTTIEGLARGETLHPVQQAFHEHHALQCGYCTPGMVMLAVDILSREKAPSDDVIRYNLDGNICRCTGYHNIVKAIRAAAESLRPSGEPVRR